MILFNYKRKLLGGNYENSPNLGTMTVSLQYKYVLGHTEPGPSYSDPESQQQSTASYATAFIVEAVWAIPVSHVNYMR